MVAHRAHQHPTEALAVARRLVAAWPSSGAVFSLESGLLAQEGRWDEMHAAAEERLVAHPDDRSALRALATVAMRKGDFDQLFRLRERLTRAGGAEAGDLNNFAWAALVSGRVEDADLESARRGRPSLGTRAIPAFTRSPRSTLRPAGRRRPIG